MNLLNLLCLRAKSLRLICPMDLMFGSHSESKLSFTNNFLNKTRNVTLKGEALFKVRKGEKPFVVKTKFGEVRVKGTTF